MEGGDGRENRGLREVGLGFHIQSPRIKIRVLVAAGASDVKEVQKGSLD